MGCSATPLLSPTASSWPGLVTSRGPITSEGGAKVLALARDLAADPRIDVLSITDNPAGHAMLSPDALGTDLISRGQEVISTSPARTGTATRSRAGAGS